MNVQSIETQVRKMMRETNINGTFNSAPASPNVKAKARKPSGLIWGGDLLEWLKKQERENK